MLLYDTRQLIKSHRAQANRCLEQWAINNRRGYVNLKPRSQSLMPSGTTEPEISELEERCLVFMMSLKSIDEESHRAASLNYEKKGGWFADVNTNGGWREFNGHKFHVVTEPKTNDFIKYIDVNFGIKKTRYYNLLNKVEDDIAYFVLGCKKSA